MVNTEGERSAGSIPKFDDPVSTNTTCTENAAKLLTATATTSMDTTSINDSNSKVMKEMEDETTKTFPQIVSRFRKRGQVNDDFYIFYLWVSLFLFFTYLLMKKKW